MGTETQQVPQEPGITGLEEVQRWIMPRFGRSEVRYRSSRYLEALLGRAARKNCWQLSETAREKTPYGMQRLLRKARWDVNGVRDDLRSYVIEHLGDPEGVLVVDETDFLKKGPKSVGVQCQYSVTAGKIENCQIGIFLAYASAKGKAFIDRELYLPQEWVEDQARRQEACVPAGTEFATKPELARRMIERVLEAGVPCRWITADEVYGRDRTLRRWLEGHRQPYVLAIDSTQYLWWHDLKRRQAVLGVREVVFLHHDDQTLEDTPEFRKEIVRQIRIFRPEIVMSADPYRRYLWHRDHRISGQVTLDAVYPYARDHLAYPDLLAEGLEPHKVKEVWMWGTEDANYRSNITDTWELKLAALRCHKSQLGDRLSGQLVKWLTQRARDMAKGENFELAEAFHQAVSMW